MSTDNVEISIHADSSGIRAGMEDARTAVAASTAQMQRSTETLAQSSRSSTQNLIDSFRNFAAQHSASMQSSAADTANATLQMSNSLSSGINDIQGGLGTLGNAFGMINRHFIALAGVVTGFGIFKEAIAITKAYTKEAMDLGRTLGISATEAGVLSLAIGDVNLTTDDYKSMVTGLLRQLKLNEESLVSMGLKTRDANGQYRNQNELIKEAGPLLAAYREGIDRNLAAQTIFGRGMRDASVIMKAMKVDMEGATEVAETLGLILSVNNVDALKANKIAMDDLEDALMGIKKAIGDAMMPVFTELSTWLFETAPAAVALTREAFGLLGLTFWSIRNGVVVLWETISMMLVAIVEPISSIMGSITKALKGDLLGAKEELSTIGDRIAESWAKSMDAMTKSSEKSVKEITNLFADGAKIEYKPSGTKEFVNPKEKGEGGEPKLMRGFEAELSELKLKFQEQNRLEGAFREFSKRQELEFWQEKLETIEKGTEDEKAIRLKAATLALALDKLSFDVEMSELKNRISEYKNNLTEKLRLSEEYAAKMKTAYGEESMQYQQAQHQILQIKRQAIEQLKQMEESAAQVRITRSIDLVEQEQEQSQLMTQLGFQSRETALANEKMFEDQMYEIRADGIRRKLELQQNMEASDPNKDPAEVAKMHEQLEMMEMAHNKRMRVIDNQLRVEQMKDWTSLVHTIESAMATMIKSLMMETMSIGNAMKAFMVTVAQAMMQTIAMVIAKMILAKMTEMIFGKAAAHTGVAGNAAVAASAAMASVAAIPFIGWEMAPEVGAATYDAAMAYQLSIPAAEKGMDVPRGMNPIVQIHEEEMVLPSGPSNVLRDMADGGGSMGGAVHFHVQTLDVGGVKDFFRRNSSTLTPGLQKLARNFGR